MFLDIYTGMRYSHVQKFSKVKVHRAGLGAAYLCFVYFQVLSMNNFNLTRYGVPRMLVILAELLTLSLFI